MLSEIIEREREKERVACGLVFTPAATPEIIRRAVEIHNLIIGKLYEDTQCETPKTGMSPNQNMDPVQGVDKSAE